MLVTVATYARPWEAHLLRLRLEADGIFAVVAHEHHVGLKWHWTVALGGAKVQVPWSAREDALSVMRWAESGGYSALLEEIYGVDVVPQCPACGSRDFNSRASIGGLLAVMLSCFFGSVAYLPALSVHECGACRRQWSD